MKKLLRSLSLAAALVLSISAASAETVLAEADFSTLTKGSEDAPELFKYSFDFTGFTGWSIVTNKTGQAGGSLYIADGGSLKSKSFAGISSSNGAIKVTLVAKLNKADMGMIQLQWGYSTTYTQIVEGNDWTTIEFVFPAASYSNQGTISPLYLADGMFVKSVKIAQSLEFIAAPAVNQPTNADGTSFTATWKAVTGATKYFIDVYSYNAAGDKVMFIENQECTTTSYKVEGLDAATTYYFVVRAANETGVSGNSEEIEVVKKVDSLATPVVKIKSYDEDGNFKASWGEVADADSYNVTIFKEVTLKEESLTSVFVEDFNSFKDHTLADPDYISESRLAVLNEPGWSGDGLYSIEGAVGFSSSFSSGYLATPAIDLSANEGKCSVKINMAASTYSGAFVKDAVVSFSTIDADDNESEPVNVTIDNLGFTDYTVNLTGCTAATKIKIATAGSDRIFVDNIEVQQLLPAGSVTTSTYLQAQTEAAEYSGKVEPADDTEYKLVVVANGRTVTSGQVTGIYSDPSEPVVIAKTISGIENVADSASDVTIVKAGRGAITVTTPVALTVEIYDISGRLVSAQPVAEGTSTISVDALGLIIVKAGTAVAKIAL